MSEFKVVFKKKSLFKKRYVVTVPGDGYFISDKDSTGYHRLTIYKRGEDRKEHTLVCNAEEVQCVVLSPSMV